MVIGVCAFDEWGPYSVQRVGLEFEFTFGFPVSVGCVCVCVCVWVASGPHAFGFGLRFSGIGLLVGVGGCYSELESACSSSIGLDLEFDSKLHAVEAGD